MSGAIEQAQQEIVQDFSRYDDWEERYAHIIAVGKDHPDIPDEYKDDKYRVKGCMSTVYLHARLEDGKVVYDATSDAMIVRGLIALLMKVYSGRTPEDILENPPHFINDLGLTENLTQGRQNGLKSMIEQIMLYAAALKALAQTQRTN